MDTDKQINRTHEAGILETIKKHPILPFSEIDKQGAGMYKGEKITLAERRDNNAVKAQEKCI